MWAPQPLYTMQAPALAAAPPVGPALRLARQIFQGRSLAVHRRFVWRLSINYRRLYRWRKQVSATLSELYALAQEAWPCCWKTTSNAAAT